MYNPAHFRQEHRQALESLMATYPLATVVTAGARGLRASHIPLLYAAAANGFGVLRGHMAKANPQWSDLTHAARALAVFTGPQHYISPSWYPSTAEHGKAVPTWNYVVVHAEGPLRVIHDREWLKQNVSDLTATHEAELPRPWSVESAPEGYIDTMLNGILGIEIAIETLEGKWKASQNRPVADRAGVISALQNLATPEADRMAEIVDEANRHNK